MASRNTLGLRSGDLVSVRSKEEILATLDKDGELDSLPFMPEMLPLCGGKFVVHKRADKTCDTIDNQGSRRMHDTVHLNMLRCDGSAHGGCGAGCLLYFKEEWLRRDDGAGDGRTPEAPARPAVGATESDLARACAQPTSTPDAPIIWRCQATRVKAASDPLAWWDVRQFVRDLSTGNASVRQMIRGFAFAGYRNFMGLGRGYRAKVALFNHWQALVGGIPFPWRLGSAEKTPRGDDLKLQPGDWVRVKSYEFILTTIDKNNKNRGLWFDAEMVKYCGKTYRVSEKVHRIIHEKFGHMIEFKNPPVILENVYCCGEMTRWRLFCPRAIHIYWRDIWLERVDPPPAAAGRMALSEELAGG